jgi:hypothetical protein
MVSGHRGCLGRLRAAAAAWGLLAMLGCAGREPAAVEGTPSGPAPSTPGMHRLNTAEYNASVRDVLGTQLQPASSSWRGGELAGFDNIASQLGVDEAQYDRYLRAAEALAAEVMASAELRARFVACDLAEPACVESSIQNAGLRLFRRPLEPDELASYGRVYASALALEDDESSAFGLTLEALLGSAQFLYRIELAPRVLSAGAQPLDGYQLASRLSYFLWSSAPDDALLASAADGSLLKASGLSAAVDRLLAGAATPPPHESKSWRFVASFAGQWLGERQVPSHVSPAWSSREARAAGEEMLLYFNDFLQGERSWLEFPTADFNYVNGELPFIYGMPVPEVFGSPPPDDWMSTEQFRRVEYAADQRAGFFGLAGFLALTSFDRRTSPSKRGKWIAANLLCAEPPEPAQALPMLETDAPAATGLSALPVRQRLEAHRNNPACASCHTLFDPYGLTLEHFDPVGRYREAYDDGSAIDVTVQLPLSAAHPDGLSVTGLAELSQLVASDPRFAECVASKLLTYALGRVLTADDEPTLRSIRELWLAPGQTPSLRRLIHALVSSEAFRFR